MLFLRKTLLSAGADVDKAKNKGCTAFMRAAKNGRSQVAEVGGAM